MNSFIDVNEILYLNNLIKENGGAGLNEKELKACIRNLMFIHMFVHVRNGNDSFQIKIKDNTLTIKSNALKEKTK